MKEDCASRSDQVPAVDRTGTLKLQPCYQATRSAAVITANLGKLIHAGTISDRSLDRRAARLKERFSVYATCYPFGLWAPGLKVRNEMRTLTETYLPFPEIRQALHSFLALSLHYPPAMNDQHLPLETTWLDFLQRTACAGPPADPALLLERLCCDERYRELFLFTLFLPQHHGGSFNRYPAQQAFLKEWLKEHLSSTIVPIRCLDAACGTGEGAYDLALLMQDCDLDACQYLIDGCSLDPFELFAAAYGMFPHDGKRQAAYRLTTAPLFNQGNPCSIRFVRDDILRHPHIDESRYRIILCNGLFGGPALHDREQLQRAIHTLAARLEEGGLLLMADRFHGGWKKVAPPYLLEELLQHYGLRVKTVGGGIAAQKEKRHRH